jgi:hypothetical protein
MALGMMSAIAAISRGSYGDVVTNLIVSSLGLLLYFTVIKRNEMLLKVLHFAKCF